MGMAIRLVTREKYNHASVSLSSDLQPLYSFARMREPKPLESGFVEESWLRYLYYDKDTKVRVFAVPLDEEAFARVEKKLAAMWDNRQKYGYDFKGLVLRRKKENKYTCLSFAVDVLREALGNPGLKINSFRQLNEFLAGNYSEEKIIRTEDKSHFRWGNDKYYEH